MSAFEEPLIPLVDEPIGLIMNRLLAENPDIEQLVSTPRRILAFRTFAYIRLGILLGELLLDNDVPPHPGDESWVDAFLQNPQHRDAMIDAMRSLAAEIAADPALADDEQIGPDSAARARFREFARQQTQS